MYQNWPKRDPVRNYFMVPNEVFSLGLNSSELSIYGYLLRCEDRRTYQCHPSYRTIGRAVDLSENTVRKYVCSLEDKGLIYTEPTMIRRRDGRPMNGSLLYTIRPIREAMDIYNQRQLRQAEEDCARQRAEERLAKFAASDRQNALCALLGGTVGGQPQVGC